MDQPELVRRTYEIAVNEMECGLFLELEDTEGMFSIWSEVDGIIEGDAGPRSIRYTVDVKRDTPELHEAFLGKLRAYVASEIAEYYPYLAELPAGAQGTAAKAHWREREVIDQLVSFIDFVATGDGESDDIEAALIAFMKDQATSNRKGLPPLDPLLEVRATEAGWDSTQIIASLMRFITDHEPSHTADWRHNLKSHITSELTAAPGLR
jgi:hypothetical protein